ncbi:hypothetical protein M433DRAFT_292615 [Acidomyces richmondensis BFW]|nr:hypothetical protein M433DRAFT_292615 [Acidomyces richmondensis BFW]
MNNRPTAYFDEVALEVWDYFGIDVHPNTIGNVLKEAGWTRKMSVLGARRMDIGSMDGLLLASVQWSLSRQSIRIDSQYCRR